MRMRRFFLLTIFLYSDFSLQAQEINKISDFFRNKKGKIGITSTNKRKLKPILGNYYYCALDYCLHKEQCNVLNTVEFLNLELQNIEIKFKKDFESIRILENRNKDSLSRINISFDTSEFRKDLHKIYERLEKFKHKVYSKNKIQIYIRQNTFDTTDLNKFINDLNDLKKEGKNISELEEKISKTFANWLNILNPIEEKRKINVEEVWFEFVKSQMKQKWDEEILRKQEKERQERLIKEEEEKKEKKEKEKNEKIEEEKRKYTDWKKNTRFSIPYRVEIVKDIIKCSYCSWEDVNKKLNFPNLNFSNYGNEKYMKKLWDEHKQIIEKEIIGYRGFLSHSVFGTLATIISMKCNNCGHRLIKDKTSTFENKVFKN